VSKKESRIDVGLLEDCLRSDLNEHAPRVMGVLKPLKVTIENWPQGTTEALEALNHPQQPEMGKREVIFSREIYIEQDDFMEDAPKKFFRLAPGREVRLRYAYFITCKETGCFSMKIPSQTPMILQKILIRIPWWCWRTAGWKKAWKMPFLKRRTSLKEWGIFVRIQRNHHRKIWFLTALLPCGIPGPR
jgi:glutamyl/glutaminyl-tRNA synthetase